MQELIADQPKNWLQLYVDAVTEKDPYKRLALVRQLRKVPRHDESEDSPKHTDLQLVPSSKPNPAKPQVCLSGSHKAKLAKKSRVHLVRSRKAKSVSKASRRSARLRNA
jgi:hypothetical protein